MASRHCLCSGHPPQARPTNGTPPSLWDCSAAHFSRTHARGSYAQNYVHRSSVMTHCSVSFQSQLRGNATLCQFLTCASSRAVPHHTIGRNGAPHHPTFPSPLCVARPAEHHKCDASTFPLPADPPAWCLHSMLRWLSLADALVWMKYLPHESARAKPR